MGSSVGQGADCSSFENTGSMCGIHSSKYFTFDLNAPFCVTGLSRFVVLLFIQLGVLSIGRQLPVRSLSVVVNICVSHDSMEPHS